MMSFHFFPQGKDVNDGTDIQVILYHKNPFFFFLRVNFILFFSFIREEQNHAKCVSNHNCWADQRYNVQRGSLNKHQTPVSD